MPRKQKQKQTQRQTVVVHVGEVRRKRRAPARRRAPRQTIEEAEYIAALNRTMPAVQINPPPASQVPMLSQEQAVGLLQSALASRPPAERSLAQREVERRDAAAHMQRTNDLLEESLAGINRRAEIQIPEHSSFSFTPTPAIVPMGEPAPAWEAIPIRAEPRGQALFDLVREPGSDNVRTTHALDFANADSQTSPFPSLFHPLSLVPSSPARLPLDRPDGNFAFASTTEPQRGLFSEPMVSTPRVHRTGRKGTIIRRKGEPTVFKAHAESATPRMLQRETPLEPRPTTNPWKY